MSARSRLRRLLRWLETQQTVLIAVVATALHRNASDAVPTPAEAAAWQTARLADVDAVVREARRVIHSGGEVYADIVGILEDAWLRGELLAVQDLTRYRSVTPAAGSIPTNLPLQLADIVESTTASLTGMETPLLRSTRDAYRSAVYDATRRMAQGQVSYQQATQEVARDLARRGLRGFTDSLGRQWLPETYAEMAVRTAYMRASNASRVEAYISRGQDLVIVSDVYGECPRCTPWEGRVLALYTGAPVPPGVTVAGTLGEAQAAGLQHPNCRHLVNAYVPGLTQPAPRLRDAGVYQQVQARNRARAQARRARRELAAARATGDTTNAQRARARLAEAPDMAQPPLFP